MEEQQLKQEEEVEHKEEPKEQTEPDNPGQNKGGKVVESDEVNEEELGKNPNVFSKTDACNKHSFVDFRQAYDSKCPPPRYLTREELLENLPVDKESVFKL